MQAWFYQWLSKVSRQTGPWFFELMARLVAAGFIVLSPKQVAASARFFRTLFADDSTSAFVRTWRQYQQFTPVFLDRFLLYHSNGLRYRSKNWPQLEKRVADGRGVIILMSHLGNWEIAAHFFKLKTMDVPVLIYMGARQKEQIERLQKEALQKQGLHIVAVGESEASPFKLLEGLQTLRNGGVVAMTGDRLWHAGQRAVTVDFSGKKVRIPEAPYRLALLSGCSIVPFFALRIAPRSYSIIALEPIMVSAPKRSEQVAVIRRAAQTYTDHLAQMARRHPNQWYHFSAFFDTDRE